MRSALTLFAIAMALTGCAELGFGHASAPEPKPEDPPVKATAPDADGFPEAEPLLAKAAEKWADHNNPGNPPTVKRTYTVGEDWQLTRDEETRELLGRTVGAVVFTQGNKSPDHPDDKCWQMLCQLNEKAYASGKWGKPELECAGSNVLTVTCKSVDRLPDRSGTASE